MKEVIQLLAEVVNIFHDLIIKLVELMGFTLTDKELHFWVIGVLGIIGFFIVDILFHQIAKWSITLISFVFTFTVVLVFVFAVEIQQKVTNRGNMEFDDAVISILGFLAFFGAFVLIKGTIKLTRKFIKKEKRETL